MCCQIYAPNCNSSLKRQISTLTLKSFLVFVPDGCSQKWLKGSKPEAELWYCSVPVDLILNYGVWVCNCIYNVMSDECVACVLPLCSSQRQSRDYNTTLNMTQLSTTEAVGCHINIIYPGWPLILYYASLIIPNSPSNQVWYLCCCHYATVNISGEAHCEWDLQ